MPTFIYSMFSNDFEILTFQRFQSVYLHYGEFDISVYFRLLNLIG